MFKLFNYTDILSHIMGWMKLFPFQNEKWNGGEKKKVLQWSSSVTDFGLTLGPVAWQPEKITATGQKNKKEKKKKKNILTN